MYSFLMLLVSELSTRDHAQSAPDPAVFLVHAVAFSHLFLGNTGECHDCALSSQRVQCTGIRLRAELIIFIFLLLTIYLFL